MTKIFKRFYSYSAVTLTMVLTLFMGGCASGPKVPVVPIAESADPTAEINHLESNLKRDQQNQVNVYAPESFSKAEEALKDARSRREDGKSNKDILEKVALGNAFLRQAEQASQVSQSALGDVVQARNRALEAKANQVLPDDFKEAESNLKNVAKKVEDGNLTSAREDRGDLYKRYHDLELNALVKGNLGRAMATLNSAKNEGALEYAPKTYAQAQRELDQAKNFILKNPTNKREIRRQAITAQLMAEDSLRFTREAKLVKNRTPEEVVSQMERQRRELEFSQLRNMAGEAVLAEQMNRVQELEARQKMNQKIVDLQKEFKPSEAVVLQIGNHIVIRLRNVEFKNGSSSIPPNSYTLLNKVQKAILDFGQPEVRVEGHTDSRGSRSRNLTLSQKRAEAVKAYLIANQAIFENKIETVGLGSSKPIASNKTAEGRAKNRRVDIVIIPEGQSSDVSEEVNAQLQSLPPPTAETQ